MNDWITPILLAIAFGFLVAIVALIINKEPIHVVDECPPCLYGARWVCHNYVRTQESRLPIMFKAKEGTFIVFEGLDQTGKTTQLEKLKNLNWEVWPYFTHQPSATGETGIELCSHVYAITEQLDIESNLARQFLHLAAHAEHYEYRIQYMIKERPIIMDRFWWSTVAYADNSIWPDKMEAWEWEQICKYPTLGIEPSHVYLFLKTYAADENNRKHVEENYMYLYSQNEDTATLVPQGSEEEVHTFILGDMLDRGLIERTQ